MSTIGWVCSDSGMIPDAPVTTVAHAIQLAVAPVFLLTGVGAILGVLTNRLGRVIDRARVLHAQWQAAAEPQRLEIDDALMVLSRRARLINWAISLCTACALLVCAVIAVLFLGSFVAISMATPIGLLFVAAMLALIVALLTFLREIYLATANLRIGPQ
jgi:hypothetical protein